MHETQAILQTPQNEYAYQRNRIDTVLVKQTTLASAANKVDELHVVLNKTCMPVDTNTNSMRHLIIRTFTATIVFGMTSIPTSAHKHAVQSTTTTAVNWNLTPAYITESCQSAIAATNAKIDAIVTGAQNPTFRSVVIPLEQAITDLNDDLAAQQFLMNVASKESVRTASQTCSTNVTAAQNAISARPEVYAALQAAQASATAKTAADRVLLEHWLSTSTRAGAGLNSEQRADALRLAAQLTSLENQFLSNVDDDTTTLAFARSTLTGLPADVPFVSQNAAATNDRVTIAVNESSVGPFMQNVRDETARKRFFIAYHNRGGRTNVQLLESALKIRTKLAALYGYPNWAAYVLADKMAGSPTRVMNFLATIDAAILPQAKSERAELAALKATDPTQDRRQPLEPWDIPFYQNQLRKSRYAVDEQTIKTYFETTHTIDAILAIYARLFSITFVPLENPQRYHPDVIGYAVYDRPPTVPNTGKTIKPTPNQDRAANNTTNGVLLGTFYLDLYPRPGKYTGFADFTLIARHDRPDGSAVAPLSVIVGNWPRPAAGRPALLTHSDVQTFFHEFGHNMAAMLARGPYASLTTGFRTDFIEAPSQMLENFAWDPDILKTLSQNVVTGAPLPDNLIRKMIATRYLDYALFTTQQILYATVDMKYHLLPAQPRLTTNAGSATLTYSVGSSTPIDTTEIWRDTITVTPERFIGETYPQANFEHLMGGYDAGYYGYLWSKVYAQDIFNAFAIGGLQNPLVGNRYRQTILAPARAIEPDAAIKAFLGRPMNPNAFYEELGIPMTQAQR